MWELDLGTVEPAFTCILSVKLFIEVFSMLDTKFPSFWHSLYNSHVICVDKILELALKF